MRKRLFVEAMTLLSDFFYRNIFSKLIVNEYKFTRSTSYIKG